MDIRGAVAERDKYFELFLRVTRATGLLMPFLLIAYGVAVILGIATGSPVYDLTFSLIIFTALLVLGVTQFILKPSTPLSVGVFIGLYHVVATLFLIFCSGFTSPISFCWVILVLITEIFYGKFAALLSLAMIAATSLLLYVLEPIETTLQNLSYPLYLLIIIATSVVVWMLRSVQVVEHQDLKRSQLQEQFQRGQLTALINSLNAAIMSTSATGTVRVYNAALLSLVDTNQALSGKNINSVLNLYDSQGEPVSLIELSRKSNKIIERDDLVHRFSDGETIRLNISCSPIRGKFKSGTKRHEGYIFILRDITTAKSLEEERDEFISVVSHELRTPITISEGSLSNLQLLLERGNDPKTLSSAVRDAHEQIIYLASMVNDLSTLSRAERSVADDPEAVNVRELIEELYHRYHDKAAEKGLSLDVDLSHRLGSVFVNRLYLEEILQNFITNAIKYTPAGSVTIAAHPHGQSIEFSVKDNGIGISKSDQKRIFEKFYRSEDYRTRETSGTGLGLYVVRKLADKLGATIKLESRLNHGSRFSFTIKKHPDTASIANNLDEMVDSTVHLT